MIIKKSQIFVSTLVRGRQGKEKGGEKEEKGREWSNCLNQFLFVSVYVNVNSVLVTL